MRTRQDETFDWGIWIRPASASVPPAGEVWGGMRAGFGLEVFGLQKFAAKKSDGLDLKHIRLFLLEKILKKPFLIGETVISSFLNNSTSLKNKNSISVFERRQSVSNCYRCLIFEQLLNVSLDFCLVRVIKGRSRLVKYQQLWRF